MNASWKFTLIFLGILLLCGSVFEIFIAVPVANKARQIKGGYHSATEARAALLKNPKDAFAHITLANDAAVRHDKAALKEWREAVRLAPKTAIRKLTLLFCFWFCTNTMRRKRF